MARIIVLLVVLGLYGVSVHAQTFTEARHSHLVVSSTVYWAGVAADIASSRGPVKFERNPLLKDGSGRLSIGKALALDGGIYALSLLLERRKPRLAVIMRYAGGGVHGAAAIHNWRVK